MPTHLIWLFDFIGSILPSASAIPSVTSPERTGVNWLLIADWFVAIGTLVLAAVAVFQETIRGWFYRARFRFSIKTEPPDCVKVPFTKKEDGSFIADSFCINLWIENAGNATARNAEVFAEELQRWREEGCWERVGTFPPMNLRWGHVGGMYVNIAPGTGKHCCIAHIVDPPRRNLLNEEVSELNLKPDQTALAFDVIVVPNHKGHIIGLGKYRLKILAAAENARLSRGTIEISLPGQWYADETKMLRYGLGVKTVAV